MSMISTQIDELREMAGKLESYDQGYGAICQALRDAADTIWQLRDDLQRANAAVQEAKHDETMAWDRVRKTEAENIKLRELVQELWVSCPVYDSDCDECKHKGGRTGCELYDRMRELRVEVDAC